MTKMLSDEIQNEIINLYLLSVIYNKECQVKDGVHICIAYSGGNYHIMRIMDWLYKDAIIYLNRKYEKFKIIKQQQVESGLKWCRDKQLIEAIL